MLLVVPMAFFASLVACNSIIGLTDFTKGECPGARCDGTEAGLDQFVPDGSTEGGPDGGFDGQGAPPAVWAQWHMPNYGEGGAGEPPFPLSYGDAGSTSGTVIVDKVTGLNWHSAPVDAVLPTEIDAKCVAAHGDKWRGAKRIELVTLLDYSHGQPYIDASRFTVGSTETLATTSPVRNVDGTLTNSYYVVDLGSGAVKTATATVRNRALCVQGK